MKPYLAKVNNDEYFLRTTDLRNYQILISPKKIKATYLGKGEMQPPAKCTYVKKIPDFLKTIFFELQKKPHEKI